MKGVDHGNGSFTRVADPAFVGGTAAGEAREGKHVSRNESESQIGLVKEVESGQAAD